MRAADPQAFRRCSQHGTGAAAEALLAALAPRIRASPAELPAQAVGNALYGAFGEQLLFSPAASFARQEQE